MENLPGSSQHAKMAKVIADPNNSLRKDLSGHLRIEMLAPPEGGGGAGLRGDLRAERSGADRRAEKAGQAGQPGARQRGVQQEEAGRERRCPAGTASAINLFDRLVSLGHFAHNKFLVFCDEDGKPRKVWTGSTNWTVTGLCTQANNGLLVEDDGVAAAFKDEWDRLRQAGNAFPAALVKANSQPRNFAVDGGKVSVWFAPTGKQEDLEQARALINAAQEGILFLMFNPGGFQDEPERWTLLQSILNRHQPDSNPDYDGSLYIHGVVNQPIPPTGRRPDRLAVAARPSGRARAGPAAPVNPVVLFQSGVATPLRGTQDVLVPAAIKEKFANWVPELKQESVAMVHSKVIVLDPFGKHPVVMTGSHNMGFKASTKNDDNLVIIENNPSLAQAYAVNIIAVYQNYQWRLYREQHTSNEAWSHLQDVDTWQDGHLTGWRGAELDFWLGQDAPAAPAAAGGAKRSSTGKPAAKPGKGDGKKPRKPRQPAAGDG